MIEGPQRRRRLVLHAGTPKTGTSALQRALYRNVDRLAEIGIWYPPADVEPLQKKHQYLVDLLLAADAAGFRRRFDEIERTAPLQTHTVVLSTEGLFNHWWDYPVASKALLGELGSRFDLHLWTCFREPVSFAISQYAQLLRNTRRYASAYGLVHDFEEMLEHEWFAKRLDYAGFIREAEATLGKGHVRAFRYGPDIVQRVFCALGAAPPQTERVHPSLRTPGVALMRIVNRYALETEDQNRAQALVLELDTLIGDRSEPLEAGDAARRRIYELNAGGWELVQAMTADDDKESVR